MIDGRASSASVVAETPMLCVVIFQESLRKLVMKEPAAAWLLMQTLAVPASRGVTTAQGQAVRHRYPARAMITDPRFEPIVDGASAAASLAARGRRNDLGLPQRSGRPSLPGLGPHRRRGRARGDRAHGRTRTRRSGGWVQLSVEELESGRLVGDVGSEPVRPRARRHQGRVHGVAGLPGAGLASEAVMALIDYAFERLDATGRAGLRQRREHALDPAGRTGGDALGRNHRAS